MLYPGAIPRLSGKVLCVVGIWGLIVTGIFLASVFPQLVQLMDAGREPTVREATPPAAQEKAPAPPTAAASAEPAGSSAEATLSREQEKNPNIPNIPEATIVRQGRDTPLRPDVPAQPLSPDILPGVVQAPPGHLGIFGIASGTDFRMDIPVPGLTADRLPRPVLRREPAAWIITLPGRWKRDGVEETTTTNPVVGKIRLTLTAHEARLCLYLADSGANGSAVPELAVHDGILTVRLARHNN